jgi:hypothetical protein
MGATMTDVYIVVFSIIGLLITYPGLAIALNLLMPRATEHAYRRLAITPFVSFGLGVVVTGFFLLWIPVLSEVKSGLIKAFAGMVLLGGLGIHATGSSALARLMGERIGTLTGTGAPLKDLVRGAVIYELACLVPVVGWFLFLPIMTISIMGAASFGLVGWSPHDKNAVAHQDRPDSSQFDEDIRSVWAANP